MNAYALQRRRDTKRRAKLRAAGKLPPLPRCERCGHKCLVDRWLPLCHRCHHNPPSPLQLAAREVLAELRGERRMEVQPEPPRPAALPIRQLVALRPKISDRVLMDWLHIRVLTGGCGFAATATLRELWGCDQSTVSRRVNAVAAAGLADITTGWGGYRVHSLRGMG